MVGAVIGWIAALDSGAGSRVADRIDAPRDLRATRVSATGAVLSWVGDTSTDSYVVTVASNPTFTRDVRDVTTDRPKVAIDDLANTVSGRHYFRVRAVDSDDAATSRAQPFALRPGNARRLTVEKVSTRGVSVTLKRVRNTSAFDVLVYRDKALTRRVLAVRTADASRRFTAAGLAPGRRYWIRYRPVNPAHRGTLSRPVGFETEPASSTFRIATWNVCSEACPGYASRAAVGARMLSDSDVDVFALQEAGGERVGAVTNRLWSGGPRQFVRATGGMKTRYIFYRPAVFEQLGGGSFGISDDKWATWAHLSVRSTGRELFVVDVHLKNQLKNDPRRGQELQRVIAGMAQLNPKGLPTVYAGDFNSGTHREPDSPGRVARAAGLVDTVTVADKVVNGQVNTFRGFGSAIPSSGAHVDHIYTDGRFAVLEWNQLIRTDGGRYVPPYVSDHNAVSAVLGLDTHTIDLGAVTATTPIPRPSAVPTSPTPPAAKATP